ncbi:MAG: succinate dehydrogenase, hydrophobic membrane anchor protein [Comamonadaceae bacterium]|nr:succinate dehydrogenase, hydrophobic membrane anchor protein [Burkholderiales bacterium]MEB2349388.1 succinate dehydrogenase, hydrophobic membrane anchor protein [Comamonadaceae bacterium]
MATTYGYKRLVVGAHYGLRDWLVQRLTAIVMALFTLALLIQLIASKGPIGYDTWAGIFASQWMKSITFATIVALIWHAWVGVQSIWMDYIKPDGLRLIFYLVTVFWLVACGGWAVQVLWRL